MILQVVNDHRVKCLKSLDVLDSYFILNQKNSSLLFLLSVTKYFLGLNFGLGLNADSASTEDTEILFQPIIVCVCSRVSCLH